VHFVGLYGIISLQCTAQKEKYKILYISSYLHFWTGQN